MLGLIHMFEALHTFHVIEFFDIDAKCVVEILLHEIRLNDEQL